MSTPQIKRFAGSDRKAQCAVGGEWIPKGNTPRFWNPETKDICCPIHLPEEYHEFFPQDFPGSPSPAGPTGKGAEGPSNSSGANGGQTATTPVTSSATHLPLASASGLVGESQSFEPGKGTSASAATETAGEVLAAGAGAHAGSTPLPEAPKDSEVPSSPADADVTRKENIAAEPPLKTEAPSGSKTPSPFIEAVEELMGLSQSVSSPNKVWVCRRTDYGRVEIAATVNQLPGEELSRQIERARSAVFKAFEEERKR